MAVYGICPKCAQFVFIASREALPQVRTPPGELHIEGIARERLPHAWLIMSLCVSALFLLVG